MTVNQNNEIIIYRYGNVYKAKVAALSTLYSFHTEINSLSSQIASYLDKIEKTIDDLTTQFDVTHYTKTEQKDRFSLIEEANNLTANEKYVLSSKTARIVKPLVSKDDIDNWLSSQSNKCFDILKDTYKTIATDWIDNGEDGEDVRGGHGILHEDWNKHNNTPPGGLYSNKEGSFGSLSLLDKGFGV